jgi:hypothetical protein
MHYLAILLVGKHVPDKIPASSLIELRQETEESLEIMKRIGKTSLVTQKARSCIKQLLSFFDTLGESEKGHIQSKEIFDKYE